MNYKRVKIELTKLSYKQVEKETKMVKHTYVGLIGNTGRTVYEHRQELFDKVDYNLN